MRPPALLLSCLLLLGSCTAAQIQTVNTDIQTAKPIVNATACQAQALANDATTAATLLGDDQAAADASMVSKATGLLCMTTKPAA